MTQNPESWVFIRGLARSQAHWADFQEKFRSRFPGTQVEALDLAGNGDQSHRSSFVTIEENVWDLRSRSQLLAAGGRISLCSISMGGMVALQWAAQFPSELNAVVLMNTSESTESAFYERLQPQSYLPFLSMIFCKNALKREQAVLRLTTRLQDNFAELELRYARLPQTSIANFTRQLWAAARFRTPSTRPEVPLLFLTGAQDALASPACSARLAARWNSELHQHPLAGHDLPLDAAEWVLDQIQWWVQNRK